MVNQKKFFILITLIFLFSMEVLATEYKSTNFSRVLLVVPPEQVQITKEIEFIAHSYPKLTQLIPQINSVDEFKIAKNYFCLSMKYDDILNAASLSTVVGTQLVELSQQVLKDLNLYNETLQGESCQAFKTEVDQKELEENFYEVNSRIARNHLMLNSLLVFPKNHA